MFNILNNVKNSPLRVLAIVLVLVCMIPVISAGVTADLSEQGTDDTLRESAQQVTFISTQGGSTHLYDHAGKLVGVHTPTNQRVFTHDEYRRYMDIDPIGQDRILFVAGERTEEGGFQRIAVVMNWRTGEELQKFEVPHDTHDVDRVSGDRFAVADKANHTAYIINVSSGQTTWEYDFRDDFGVESGDHEISGDWTHLNDIDLHDNGQSVLLSPRDFDRVMLLNRSTGEIAWTLGSQDQHDILHAQHNPVLLDDSPPTVLVADSENDRLVEYRRLNGSWQQIWRYQGDLHWPRDADRLPNGNTLVVDTFNDRVVEVTPGGETVWQYHISRSPYDVERLEHGDEPAGPPMAVENETTIVGPQGSSVTAVSQPYKESFSIAYQLVGAWIVPVWAGQVSFLGLCLGIAVLIMWAGLEVAIRIPVEPKMPADASEKTLLSLAGGGLLGSLGLAVAPLIIGPGTARYGAIALTLLAVGFWTISRGATNQWPIHHRRALYAARMVLIAGSATFSLALLAKAALVVPSPRFNSLVLSLSVAIVGVVALVKSHPAIRQAKR